ncbi:unnamed protein product [Brachionus calyciflorus]|uniref:ISXO2-like transposase domain-containing protein n=1 Tax=Brachionus calyciflorus TaxID=104777 RepID=A0A814BT16_9BILA|nr:unnamed protein product [Brachionus calyciflorus]
MCQGDIKDILAISRPPIIKIFQMLRIICLKNFNKDSVRLGGSGMVVEIDESLFVKIEHNKGKDLQRERVWVFGLYERETGRCLFFVFDKRDSVNLLNIIYKFISPNTTIHSDCWSAYNRIKLLDRNFRHLTVNHDLHFVDPKTRCHTNSIESIWRKTKQYLKKNNGKNLNYLQAYLDEFSWRHNQSLSRFGTFSSILDTISRVVPADPHHEFKFYSDINADSNDCECEDDDDNEPEAIEPLDDELVEQEKSLDLNFDVTYMSDLDLNKFHQTVEVIIGHIKSGLYNSFRFLSVLSSEQRMKVYELCDSNGISYEKSGTRYKVINIFKNLEKSANDDGVNAILKSMSNMELSRASNVEKVISNDDGTKEKKKRGRPRKNIFD